MNNQQNTRNIVIGFVLGIVTATSLGAALKHNNELGRFQVAAGGGDNAYVVDTVTGEVWVRSPKGARQEGEFRLPKAEAANP